MTIRTAATAALLVTLIGCTGDREAAPTGSPSQTPAAAATAPGAPVFDWAQGPNMPTPRTEVAVAAIGSRVWVAGGFTADGQASAVVEVLDAGSGEWSSFTALPSGVHHAALVAIDDRLYLIGGYGEDGAATERVLTTAPEDTDWREAPSMPTARGALAAAAVGGRIHAVGGASSFGGTNRLTAAHEIFDPASGEWSTAPPLPDPRDHLAAAGLDGVLYVAGGRKLSLTSNVARLDVFGDGRWSRGPDMPTARGGLAASAANGLVFVFGGEEPQGTIPAAEFYDPVNGAWGSAPGMPTARHGLGAAVVAGGIYVVAGGPRPGLHVSGATEVLVRR